MVAALKWINENIEEFGGDPGNITLFGQSGGGGKVAALMAMPSAKGLFQRPLSRVEVTWLVRPKMAPPCMLSSYWIFWH